MKEAKVKANCVHLEWNEAIESVHGKRTDRLRPGKSRNPVCALSNGFYDPLCDGRHYIEALFLCISSFVTIYRVQSRGNALSLVFFFLDTATRCLYSKYLYTVHNYNERIFKP